jgi:multidrug efflux system outer membrane protein
VSRAATQGGATSQIHSGLASRRARKRLAAAARLERPRRWAAFIGLTLLAGCAPKVKLEPPVVQPPAGFSGTAMPGPEGPVPIRRDEWPSLSWWKIFEDPQLESLITEALARNNNLTVAAQQVEVARALARQSRSALLPQASLAPSADWRRASNNAPTIPAARGTLDDFYSLPVTLSYEFDFWNKNKLALQSAQSLAAASEQDWRTLYIQIVSDVAATYFSIATALDEIRITEQTLDSYRENLKFVQRQYDVGTASELDRQRARTQISQTEALLPAFRLRVQELQHRLALLLGRNPGDGVPVRALLETKAPAELPGGVPSGLLQRRPDIRAQQDRVKAAAARVGVARALFFPDFTLNIAAGAVSISTGSLFLPGSFAMDFIASAVQPLFRGGALEANFDANVAAYKQEVAAYQETVLTAFRETADAISQVQELTNRRDRLRQAVGDQDRSYQLAIRSYKAGATSYLDVLDAQRNLLAAQDALSAVEGQRFVAMISLYKSLGGGWDAAER